MEKLDIAPLVLEKRSEQGRWMRALFAPAYGMNLLSLQWGEIEILDLSTRSLFEERYAGLGALIGPHFHRRPSTHLPAIPHEERFPHIARVRAQGVQDPFSHGIGRYAPWRVLHQGTDHVEALLEGKSLWEGVPIQDLEGMPFTMRYTARLLSEGIHIELAVASEGPSVIGLHTYYALPQKKGVVRARVEETCQDQGKWKAIPQGYGYDKDHHLKIPLTRPIDLGFRPFPDRCRGDVWLDTESYRVHLSYISPDPDNAFQVWHPPGESFVCLEPLSAADPRHPQKTESYLSIKICIAPVV